MAELIDFPMIENSRENIGKIAEFLSEKLKQCNNELEAIEMIAEGIAMVKNISIVEIGFICSEIEQNCLGLRGKKTILTKGVKSKRKNGLKPKKRDNAQSINQPLPRDSFPDIIESDEGKISVLPSLNNLKHMINCYGVVMQYDEAAKHQSIEIPVFSNHEHDLSNEANYRMIENLAVINGIGKDIAKFSTIIMQQNTINPIKDWILSKEWDGISRLADLFGTLKVDNRVLTNKILLAWFVQCVAALDKGKIGTELNPHAIAKYELILTFQGVQGAKKTTWFRRLLPVDMSKKYIGDSVILDVNKSDSVKQAISYWIAELGELDATFKKNDISALKSFTSRTKDRMRLPYAATECDFLRSTSFCGSVNDEQFLHDATGSRRFGVIKVNDIQFVELDLQQVWRELWELYVIGEPWWLSKEIEAEMQANNEKNHQVLDPVEDAILSKFNWNCPVEERDNRMTMTEIYQAMFDRKPSKTDLNKIRPFLEKLGVKIISPKNVQTAFMPMMKS